jgi:hypothetical protein
VVRPEVETGDVGSPEIKLKERSMLRVHNYGIGIAIKFRQKVVLTINGNSVPCW